MKRTWTILAVAASLGLVAAACGGGEEGTTPTPATGGGTSVSVTLADFSVTADPASVGSGMVTFNVTNNGPSVHEFVVFKSDLAPDALPVEGTKVNEEAAEVEAIGEIEDIEAGATQSTTFDLQPGKYVLICNIEGHYQSGMRATFEVTG